MNKVQVTKKETDYGVGYPGYNISIEIDLPGFGQLTDASWPNVNGPDYGWFKNIAAAKAAYNELPEGEVDLDAVVPYLDDIRVVDIAKAGFQTPLILDLVEKYLAGARPDYAAYVREKLNLTA